MDLKEFFAEHPACALGFSGGADSAYLLAAGLALGADIRPYYVRTAFQPAFELADARRLCSELGAELTLLEYDILAVPEVRSNPRERCYFCKRAIFSLIRERAVRDGYDTVLDGTNASDDLDDRPGWRAIRELGVLSPLLMCGITKAVLRRESEKLGLFTARKPAYACLATRASEGMELSPELLGRVERAEEALSKLGYADFRVRLTREGFARLELPEALLERAIAERGAILAALGGDFARVTLDLKGR